MPNSTLPSIQTLLPPSLYTEELLQRICALAIGPDHWSEAIANIRLALNTAPNFKEREIQHTTEAVFMTEDIRLAAIDSTHALLNGLQQPFDYFTETDRQNLINHFDPSHPGVLALSQTQATLQLCLENDGPALPADATQGVIYLIEVYRDYQQALKQANSEQLAKLLAPKAQISGVDIGFYYVSLEIGYTLACKNRFGDTIKKNSTGGHAVASLGGVHYKPTNNIDPIQPNAEHAICSLQQMLAENQIAAASTVIKVRGLPLWEVPHPDDLPAQSKTVYQTFTARRYTANTEEIFAADPALASQMIVVPRPHMETIVQAGYTINGIGLIDAIRLCIAFASISQTLSQTNAEALIQQLITNPDYFIDIARQQIPELQNELDIDTERETLFKAFYRQTKSLSTEQRLEEFRKGQKAGHRSTFNAIYSEMSSTNIMLLFGIFQQYPALMATQNLYDWLQLPKLIERVLPEVIIPCTAEAAFEQVPNLFKTLDEKSSSELFLGSLYSFLTDGRFDNFMLLLQKNMHGLVKKSMIIGIDNDKGFSLPILVEKRAERCLVTIKNSLCLIPEFMQLRIHPEVCSRLLSQSPEYWIIAWLQQLGLRDKACERWLLQGCLNKHDTHDSAGIQIIDLPFHIPPSVVLYIYRILTQLHTLLRQNNGRLTHHEILLAILPEIAKLYQLLRESGTNLVELEKQLCRGAGPRALTRERWAEVSELPFERALEILPDNQVYDKELGFLVRSMVKRFAEELPWYASSPEQQLVLIEPLVSVFPELILPLTKPVMQRLLPLAIPKGLIATIRWLLSKGVTIEPGYDETARFSTLSALFILCRHWYECPDQALPLLTLFLQFGANPNAYSPRGYTPLLELLNNCVDDQAHLLEPVLNQLCQAGAIIDLPAFKSILFPLDSLIERRTFGKPNVGMPRLFAILVKLGARRVNAANAIAFMQRYAELPEIKTAFETLIAENLDIAWLIQKQRLWIPCVSSSDKGHFTHLGGEAAQFHPSLASLILTGEKRFRVDSEQDEKEGRRTVKRLRVEVDGQIIATHAKHRPELPGVEYSVYRLSQPLMGRGIVPSHLIALDDPVTHERYPVQLTPTIVGYKLRDVLTNPELMRKILPKLESESLSAFLCFSMLINPEDGKPSNYMVIESKRHPGYYEIVGIDNDHAFIPASFAGALQVKCVLFCLEQMQQPIHPNVVALYRSLDIDSLLESWLHDVDTYHQDIAKTFSDKDAKTLSQTQLLQRAQGAFGFAPEHLPIILRMPFRARSVAWLYEKLTRMQAAFIKNPDIKPIELLHIVEPDLGPVYQTVFTENPTPYERFIALIAKSQGLITTLQGEKTLSTSKDINKFMGIRGDDLEKLIHGDKRFGADFALTELKIIRKQRNEQHIVLANLLQGNAKSFTELLLDETKATIVKNIDFKKIVLADGQPDIVKQKAILQLLIATKTQFRRLHLANCAALTDELLQQLLAYSPFVTRIDVNHCVNLTHRAFATIEKFAASIESLNISGLPLLSHVKSSARFMRLKHLNLSDNQKLTQIELNTPILQHLRIHRSALLSHISLRARQLRRLDAAYTNLPLPKLQLLLNDNPQLVNLDITAVSDIDKLKLPAYLQALTLDATDISFGILVAYLSQNQELAKLSITNCHNIPVNVQTFLVRALPLKHQFQANAATVDNTQALNALQQLLLGDSKIFTLTEKHQPKTLWWLALQVHGIRHLRIDTLLSQEDCKSFNRYLETCGPLESLVLKHDVTSTRALENLQTIKHYANYHYQYGKSCKVSLTTSYQEHNEALWLEALIAQLPQLPAIDGFLSPWGEVSQYTPKVSTACFALLPNNTLAMGKTDNTITIWHRNQTQEYISELRGHTGKITALLYNIQNQILISGADDNCIKLWRIGETHAFQSFVLHTAPISSLVSVTDEVFASASLDGTIRLWDLKQLACLTSFPAHNKPILSLAMLLDLQLVSSDGGCLQVWDIMTGTCRKTITIPEGQGNKLLAISKNRLVMAGYDGTIRLLDIAENQLLTEFTGHNQNIYALTPLPDGKMASAGRDKLIRIWDLSTSQCVAILTGHDAAIGALVACSNGELISAGFDKSIHTWSNQQRTHRPFTAPDTWKALNLTIEVDSEQRLIIQQSEAATSAMPLSAAMTASSFIEELQQLMPSALFQYSEHALIIEEINHPALWQEALTLLLTPRSPVSSISLSPTTSLPPDSGSENGASQRRLGYSAHAVWNPWHETYHDELEGELSLSITSQALELVGPSPSAPMLDHEYDNDDGAWPALPANSSSQVPIYTRRGPALWHGQEPTGPSSSLRQAPSCSYEQDYRP